MDRFRNTLRYPLDDVLSAEANVRVLRLLCEFDSPLSAPDCADRTGLTVPGTRKALSRLLRTGFVVRVGGGRAGQYELRRDEPLPDALRAIFRAEQSRYEALLTSLRAVFVGVPEITSAWIERTPSAFGEPLEIIAVTQPTAAGWIRSELRTKLIEIERTLDQVIEVSVRTRADAPSHGPDAVALLVGDSLWPQPGASASLVREHSDLDARATRLAHYIARALEKDPLLAQRARRHVDRLVTEGQGAATGDLLEWRQILETYSAERLREFLVSDSSRAERLRQSSPFFAVLSAVERDGLVTFLEGQQ